MIKEFLTDTLEIDRFLEKDVLLKKDYIRKRNEYVSQYQSKSKKSFFGKVIKPNRPASDFTSLERIRVVVDSLIDETNVESVCRKERISVETYDTWKKDFLDAFNRYSEEVLIREKIAESNKNFILKEANQEAYQFFKKHSIDAGSSRSLVIPAQEKLTTYSNFCTIQNVFILNKMNNFRMINKHLEEVNEKLPEGGMLLGCFETFRNKNEKSTLAKIPVVKHLYFSSQFVLHRVMPKMPYLKKLYFAITKGKGRLLSKAESLGRLVSCGFEIVDFEVINGVHYFAAKKVKEPSYDMSASYGPLFKMRRVGKHGKIIGVYKFRTMHPYSEYLQDYVLKLNGYSETGKPADDFRIVPWGKFLRRYWLDELPQLINVLKGELKLVGVRPVSQRYFNDIPSDVQELRLTQKPGCIPPYVALNRQSSVNSVLQAEKEYLLEKVQRPYSTDMRYFLSAMYNIIFKQKRSA